MIGRAGRPQFDQHGVAVVFCHDIKKHFFKRFLYEPFPVESSYVLIHPSSRFYTFLSIEHITALLSSILVLVKIYLYNLLVCYEYILVQQNIFLRK